MKNIKKGFTLVELVIVAVILSILATVGFISYEEYLVDTRDSKRLAQLTGLRDGLRLGITKGQLPFPDDHVEIRNNSTLFLYQGYAGENVLQGISYSEETKDPFDDSYYTYMLSRNRKDFQILGFLEEYNPDIISSTISKTYAEDYSQRYPQVMGKKLGIVLEQETNTPLQNLPEYTSSGYMDLQDATANLFDAYVTDLQIISGKENDLIGIIPFITCQKILENGGTYGNGIYNINPSGLSPFEVYCDMEMDGGGWTLVGRSHESGFGRKFGWLVNEGTIRDDSTSYSLGQSSVDLNFSEILLTTYSTGKDIELAFKVSVDRNFTKDEDNYDTINTINDCTEVFPTTTTWMSPCDSDGEDGKTTDLRMTEGWGGLKHRDGSIKDDGFFFSAFPSLNNMDVLPTYGFQNIGYARFHIGGGAYNTAGDFAHEQGMLFVR